jgi:hypothetical protein
MAARIPGNCEGGNSGCGLNIHTRQPTAPSAAAQIFGSVLEAPLHHFPLRKRFAITTPVDQRATSGPYRVACNSNSGAVYDLVPTPGVTERF